MEKWKTVSEANEFASRSDGDFCTEIEGLGEALATNGRIYSAIAGRQMKPWQLAIFDNIEATA